MPNAPTTLCRQHLALKLIARSGGDPDPKRFLEIGVGEGEFISLLAARGYEGRAIDVSADAIETARATLASRDISGIDLEQADLFAEEGQYPLVSAFEVLEHIEDDEGAMAAIRKRVAPGGRFLFSVPAHMSMWGPSDEIVGHVRRYERAELADKLHVAGFEVEHVWSVAVPVGNLTRRVVERANTKRMGAGDALDSQAERTQHSGLDRAVGASDRVYALAFNNVTMQPVYWLQNAFLSSDRGTGFIGVARASL